MTETPLTCVVADDHPAVLDSVSRLLAESGVAVAGQAQEGEEAARLIEELRPDVALLDLRMRGLTGIEVARRCRSSSPGTAIVLFTSFGDQALLREALEAGARGYVLKEAPLDEVLRALATVGRGGTYVDGGLASAVGAREARACAPELTPRERDVLRLLAEGLRNEEVGRRLSISPETVKVHVTKAMRKLGADTRTQAVAEALRRSLIS